MMRRAYEDQRGAVMLTGLFMSCFLIGSLWFLIGIGDAIVFREKMQEATDHGAFASAALQAKGMNFISLCNLIILAAVTIHIIMGIVSDVKLAIAIISCATYPPVACVPNTLSWIAWVQKWNAYFNKMKPAAKAIHGAQVVASYAYPAMGLIEAGQIGRKYTSQTGSTPSVLALSSSLIPAPGPMMKKMGGKQGLVRKMGLPVEERPFSGFCQKLAKVGINQLLSMGGQAPTGELLTMVKSLIGGVIQARYCNKIGGLDPGWNSFWGEDGEMVVYGAGGNGGPWFQTWAINLDPKLQDVSESKVGIAARQITKYTKEEKPGAYIAQAEMYFDCDSTWTDAPCNLEDNATFQIKWRARLRRVQAPAITTGVVGMGLEMLLNLPAYQDFKNLEGKIGGKIAEWVKDKAFGQTQVKALIDGLTRIIEGEIKKGAGGIARDLDPQFGGIYH